VKKAISLNLIGCVLAMLLAAATSWAQVPRAYVSEKNGNDSNTCDVPTAACQTLSGAHSKVASSGEIYVLDSGNYGLVEIQKPVTITVAPGADAGIKVTQTDTYGVKVNAGSTDVVVIRGLTIRAVSQSNAAHGIHVAAGGAVLVENCNIRDFAYSGSRGILMSLDANSQLTVKDTTVRGCDNGVYVNNTNSSSPNILRAALERVRFEDNYQGILAGNKSNVTVRASVAAGNTSVGFRGAGTSQMTLEDCLTVGNGYGILTSESAVVRVSNSSIVNNGTGLYRSGSSSIQTRSNNTREGNTTDGSFTTTFSAQ
jgi:hypothetical protein